jgi:erythronate-4-phosphate dehydrogenase
LDAFVDLDFITLHTPLTYQGPYPTYHLIAEKFLKQQKPGCVLLNTSRGAVIDFAALKQYGAHLRWCLDVWENEPVMDGDILQNAFLATPHIAGYSVQSKYRGIDMIYQAVLRMQLLSGVPLSPIPYPTKAIPMNRELSSWQEWALAIYDPMQTTVEMKESLLNNTKTFDELRKQFVDRYEWDYVRDDAVQE